jgi:hypothetical protein
MNLIEPILIEKIDVDLENLKSQLMINKTAITATSSNSYDILIKSKLIDDVLLFILNEIYLRTNQNIYCYVKNLCGYFSNDFNGKLTYNKNTLKENLKVTPQYSFILVIDSKMNVELKNHRLFEVSKGQLLIFNTNDFLNDISEDISIIALVGSLTNINDYNLRIEKSLI